MPAFAKKLQIRFEDADPAGIVFYPRAIALAHSVLEDLVGGTPIGWEGWFAHKGLAAPVRHAEADFLAPMRAGETIDARAWIEKLGETSATFVVEFSGPQGTTCARIRTVHVLVDRENGRPVPLTDDIRGALAPFSA